MTPEDDSQLPSETPEDEPKAPAPKSSGDCMKSLNKIICATLNVRSLFSIKSKLFQTLQTFLSEQLDVLVLTETWLKAEPKYIPSEFAYTKSNPSQHQGVLTICLKS